MTATNLDTLSVEERVNRALHRLTVLSRLCMLSSGNQDSDDAIDFGAAVEDEGDFWDGLLELIEQTREELDPIRHAPAEVANWTPEAGAAAEGGS